MEIIHDVDQCAFLLVNDKQQIVGEIDYREGDGNILYAPHTEVNPAYEGHGYAMQLLEALAAYAEECGAKIVPTCSYVVQAFQKYPEKFAGVIKTK